MKKYKGLLAVSVLAIMSSCGGSGAGNINANEDPNANETPNATVDTGTTNEQLREAVKNYMGTNQNDELDTLSKVRGIMNLDPFVYIFGNIYKIFDFTINDNQLTPDPENTTTGGLMLSLEHLRSYKNNDGNPVAISVGADGTGDLLAMRNAVVAEAAGANENTDTLGQAFAYAYFNTIKTFLDATSLASVTTDVILDGDADAIDAATKLYNFVQIYKKIKSQENYSPDPALASGYTSAIDGFTATTGIFADFKTAAIAFVGTNTTEGTFLQSINALNTHENERITKFETAFGDISSLFDFSVDNNTNVHGSILAANLRSYNNGGDLGDDGTSEMAILRTNAIGEYTANDHANTFGPIFAYAYANTIKNLYNNGALKAKTDFNQTADADHNDAVGLFYDDVSDYKQHTEGDTHAPLDLDKLNAYYENLDVVNGYEAEVPEAPIP